LDESNRETARSLGTSKVEQTYSITHTSLRDFYYMHKVKRVQEVLEISGQNEMNRSINLCERILKIRGTSVPREEFGVVSSPKGTFYGDVTQALENTDGSSPRSLLM
jgi:DNA topoisomerase VI subunit A